MARVLLRRKNWERNSPKVGRVSVVEEERRAVDQAPRRYPGRRSSDDRPTCLMLISTSRPELMSGEGRGGDGLPVKPRPGLAKFHHIGGRPAAGLGLRSRRRPSGDDARRRWPGDRLSSVWRWASVRSLGHDQRGWPRYSSGRTEADRLGEPGRPRSGTGPGCGSRRCKRMVQLDRQDATRRPPRPARGSRRWPSGSRPSPGGSPSRCPALVLLPSMAAATRQARLIETGERILEHHRPERLRRSALACGGDFHLVQDEVAVHGAAGPPGGQGLSSAQGLEAEAR